MVKTQRPLAGKASGHAQRRTDFAGSAHALCIVHCTTALPVGSKAKTVVVTVLALVFELSPALADVLGRIVTACWRQFPEV